MNAPSSFWQTIRASHRLQRQTPSIRPAPRHGHIPLSFAQERLWHLDQIHPDGLAHNLRSAIRFIGTLEQSILVESLRSIISRHEILRTSFPAQEGQPVQCITEEAGFSFSLVDLSQQDTLSQEEELYRLATQIAQQPFHLDRVPLLRFMLLRMSATTHILLHATHHIIYDRWSESVLLRELAHFYKALSEGHEPSLPPLPIQYADFAYHQRAWLQGSAMEEQLAYWKSVLMPPLVPLMLPEEPHATIQPTYQGSAQYAELPASLVKALKVLGEKQGVSLFIVLLSAFKALLYCYSRQEDILLCSSVAGRIQPEIKELIGYFNNIVLLRTHLNEKMTFQETMQQVGQTVIGALEHQAIPLQQIAQTLSLPGVLLSRVLFMLQNVPPFPNHFAGLQLEPIDLEEGISNFDLSLAIKESATGGLKCVLRYKKTWFREETIQTLLARYQEILQKWVESPEQTIQSLPDWRDQTSLALTSGQDSRVEESLMPPKTSLEIRIAKLWQEILGTEIKNIDANFFDLGGRSISMVQMSQQLQEHYAWSIPVADLFAIPTVRGMANYLERAAPTAGDNQTTRPPPQAATKQRAAMQQQRFKQVSQLRKTR